MNTDRRMLLGAGAALALPTWMSRAFAGEDATPAAPETPSLAQAEQRARAVGKPLLVILTDARGDKVPLGSMWGHYFLHATQEIWLDMALVEVVCLPLAALGEVERTEDRGDLWAVLIETDEQAGRRLVRGGLTTLDTADWEDDFFRQVLVRAGELAQLLRAAIVPDQATLERRSKQSIASLSEMDRDGFGRFGAALVGDHAVRFVDLDRFAALVRRDARPLRQEQLALGARMRLFEQDPPGAHWKTNSEFCPPCGMGYVPPASRYFLQFYTQ